MCRRQGELDSLRAHESRLMREHARHVEMEPAWMIGKLPECLHC